MKHLLDNIPWRTLTGPHAEYAAGAGEARRYARGFSPIVGFADPERPNFTGLSAHCEPGEHFYCEGWTGAAQAGWRIDFETTMFKMVWESAMPDVDESEIVPLGLEHVTQALDLVGLTRPGLFGPRTIELGEYLGRFESQQLIAMAGERMFAGAFREISGVCTHPDFRGRGLAHRLMFTLMRRQMLRGETPFLHVMHDNVSAFELYERMGFRVYREVVVRIISPG